MWGSTCIPSKVYQVLYPLKRHFRCAQAQHFLIFCWLVMALIRDPGKGTLKGLGRTASHAQILDHHADDPSGQWDAAAVMRAWPPPHSGRSLLPPMGSSI